MPGISTIVSTGVTGIAGLVAVAYIVAFVAFIIIILKLRGKLNLTSSDPDDKADNPDTQRAEEDGKENVSNINTPIIFNAICAGLAGIVILIAAIIFVVKWATDGQG